MVLELLDKELIEKCDALTGQQLKDFKSDCQIDDQFEYIQNRVDNMEKIGAVETRWVLCEVEISMIKNKVQIENCKE